MMSGQRPGLRSNKMQASTRLPTDMSRVEEIRQTRRTHMVAPQKRSMMKGAFVYGRGSGNRGPNAHRSSKSTKKGWKQTWIFKPGKDKPTMAYFLPRQNMPRMNMPHPRPPGAHRPARPPAVQRPRPSPGVHFGSAPSPPVPMTSAATHSTVHTQPPVPAGPTPNPRS